MSYIEELRASRDKPQVAYQEFALHTKKGKDGLFCFFEGKDNGYYILRIKKYTDKYHPILCGGREKVLKVQELIAIHSEYDKYKKAFFIDRDFNPPLTNKSPQIFETPCYSIENFYVSENVFREIMINKFYFSEVSDPSFQVCPDLYRERQKEFHQATILLNAWYACLINKRNNTGEQTGVNLDDKIPKNFLQFSLQLISADYDIDKIKQTFPSASTILEDDLNTKVAQFSNCEKHKVFRGKYEMQFLITFIELILQDSLQAKKYILQKIKFSFNQRLTNEQAIDVFSSYADTPKSLEKFLQQVT